MISAAIQDAPGFRLAGVASTAAEAETLVARRRPDVLLVDYRLRDAPGTELVRTLRQAGWTMPVLMMTATAREGLNETAVEAGAQGVVVKRPDPQELLSAIRRVATGARIYEAAHPRRTAGRAGLSPREREVLGLAAAGNSTKQISLQLGVSAETVKTLLSRIYQKLGAANRPEAISKAFELGLL